MSASRTVYVVDDDGAVRKALRQLLTSAGLDVEEFASGPEFLEAVDLDRPGCLLLDIRMSGMSGLDLQEELATRRSILPIIFVTGHGDVALAVRAMQNGAVDFLEKPFRDEELLGRIEEALERDAENRKILLHREEILERIRKLTPREREIMNMVVDGSANKAVAFDLGISERTVEIHRSRVMRKMRASSLAHLVRMVITVRPS